MTSCEASVGTTDNSMALVVEMAGFGQGGTGCRDSVPVVSGGVGSDGEAGDGGQELEAVVVPVKSG
uniref:DUF834 domain-containing protein n=1 Tax=Oryza meridionalis TaxID=40149 RepID=A0A0E0EWH4_9ORYZ